MKFFQNLTVQLEHHPCLCVCENKLIRGIRKMVRVLYWRLFPAVY